MKSIFILLFFAPVFGSSQTLSRDEKRIDIGKKDIIHSAILNEDREIWIYTPASYNAGSQNTYPVMYFLDGPSFFYPVTGIVQYLSSVGQMPEMIVVGIANTKRVRDLTPTRSITWSDGEKDTAALGLSGGGENFISFIEKELFPYVNTKYRTMAYRMFVGHSLGGLTVLNALFRHPALFTSYVAIDPSVWWDDQLMMRYASQSLSDHDFSGKSLYYASANTLKKDMDTLRVSDDTSHASIHVRNNLQFRQILQDNARRRLQWNWKYYPEDGHTSIPLIAGYDAMRFLFRGYSLDKDMNDTSIAVNYIIEHYNKVSVLLQYKVLPSEALVNSLGYNFLSYKNYDKAYDFFKLNLENYPSSANAWDSMGDYYLEKNDRKNAMGMFRKALSLQELPGTRKKLEALEINK